MACLTQLLLLHLVASFVSAAPTTNGRTQYAPSVIPSVWTYIDIAPPSSLITFDLIFAPRDALGLEGRMLEIVRSQSAWLTEEEIASYIAPLNEAKAVVEASVKSMGATNLTYSRNLDTLTVTSTIVQAAKFFSAQFHEYHHTEVGAAYYKTLEYTIPACIEAHISDISPFATFSHVRRHSRQTKHSREPHASLNVRSSQVTCDPEAVTSACIRALYGYDTYTPTTSTGTARLGIMAYIGQNFAPSDLTLYLQTYRAEAASYIIPVTTIDGGNNIGTSPKSEASLDTQTAAGIIYPLPSGFYDLGTAATSGDIFLLTFQYFLGLSVSARPSVITISYGLLETAVTSQQANSMCTAAQQLSAAGMTIVVSSGDEGVGGSDHATCPTFVPTYPSGCLYILSVGATQNFSPEVMVDTSLAGFYSGAGFSNYFTTPSYQTSVVATYEGELGTSDNGFYNKAGRAYPDVSAQGSLQEVIVGGIGSLVGGTSASAPIVASGLTLLNDLLITAGKATVGWANPMFYANPTAFTDVATGGSYNCSGTSYGLPAGPGWDASAGLGTPLFSQLRVVYGV